jgi:magnesium-transporting ATPase (P-type)
LPCIEENPQKFFESLLILLIVILNAVMGVLQKSKAEKALDALQNMSAPHARVIRDEKEQLIGASQLVPGDIIRLETGDFVLADVRLLQSVSLKSEESALTGESVPSEKDEAAIVEMKAALGDRKNMVFSGCSITYGTAQAIVTATGMNTEIGKIANLLEGADDTQTLLQKKLAQLGKYLGILALAACTIIFIVGIFNGTPILEIFMTPVSLAVSAIPKELPAIVTIVLSIGVQRIVNGLTSMELVGMIDPVIFKSEKTKNLIFSCYNNLIKQNPSIFGAVYRLSDWHNSTSRPSPVYWANASYADRLEQYIMENWFDTVICTHLYRMEAKKVTIVTNG